MRQYGGMPAGKSSDESEEEFVLTDSDFNFYPPSYNTQQTTQAENNDDAAAEKTKQQLVAFKTALLKDPTSEEYENQAKAFQSLGLDYNPGSLSDYEQELLGDPALRELYEQERAEAARKKEFRHQLDRASSRAVDKQREYINSGRASAEFKDLVGQTLRDDAGAEPQKSGAFSRLFRRRK